MSTPRFTPGPWQWEMNKKTNRVNIVSLARLPRFMHETVMDFVRWGMANAAPRLRKASKERPDSVLMHRIEEFGAVVNGREHHADWFLTIDHPDAHLMVAAPELYEALDSLLSVNREMHHESDTVFAAVAKGEAALARARGEQ